MDAEKKAVLAVVALVCMTILYTFLFVSLWTYKELVGVSLLGLISVSVLLWRMVDARGKLNEQELRHLRYRYQEETPLDAQGEAHYWPQGAQTNPHRRSPYSYQPSQYEGYQEQQRQEHEPLMKERQQRRARPGTAGQAAQPQHLTKAVTHIRLSAANAGKLDALDALAAVYLTLAQAYVTLFCTEERPNTYRETCFATPLSERWQRVAIQQAAGIAHSWHTNREQAHHAHLEAVAIYQEKQQAETLDPRTRAPEWREWQVPTLKQPCIQANVNVVALEVSQDSTFDYWLRVSTLEKRNPIRVPVKLSDYHRKALAGQTINSSMQLSRRQDGTWWLTLSYDEVVTVQTSHDAPVIGIDVGIANFVTTSDGKRYGTFHGKLRERRSGL